MNEKPLVKNTLERPAKKDPVMIDLFGDGTEREIRYTIGTLKRLKGILGKSMMGLRGTLLELDESVLPTLIFEGLRHGPTPTGGCQCGHHGEDGSEPDVSLAALDEIEVAAYPYMLLKFSEAYTASKAEKKMTADEVLAVMTEAAATTVNL